ncbi:MAG: tRNA preQ1(34) S-adenosylmethionine ribosyltransferase-isomerase QueA, partial [Epsilonproteobacteria bacterium]|nr:tRNA preQ1(34) S-adenosylmethionine ribosyltransferase-isomerase QueA [Campylobacterota bacterium]
PPYIKKQCEDNSRYQTVYAERLGSSAAPTAGFHFTPDLLAKIQQIGVEIVDITLHIGLGTFRPVKVQDSKDHIMHSEYFEVSEEASKALNKAKSEGRRIIAVGTTSTRTLEAVWQKYGRFVACQEATDIFISPGYKFVAIDALITNFHLPKSTLIMLVSAFIGREFTMQIYAHAIKERYRFFSFGDAMFIYGKQKELLS